MIRSKYNLFQALHTLDITIPSTPNQNSSTELFNDMLSIIKNEARRLENLSIVFRYSEELKLPPNVLPDTLKTLLLKVEPFIFKETSYKPFLEQGSIPSSVHNLTIEHPLFRNDPVKLIPSSVTTLKILHWVNNGDELDMVPDSVTSLALNGYIRNNLTPGCLTTKSSLTKLEFCSDFHIHRILLPGVIPLSVKDLMLGICTFPLVPGSIPQNVVTLEFIYRFNQVIKEGMIPFGVESIKFGSSFNQTIEKGSIPSTTKSLAVYSQALVGYIYAQQLPSTLTKLSINEKLDSRIQLPSTLKYLYCSFGSKGITVGLLPEGLEDLTISSKITNIEVGSLPNSLKMISFFSQLEIPLPEGTLPNKELTDVFFVAGISEKCKFPVIPSTVKTLLLESNDTYTSVPIPVGALPHSLRLLFTEFNPLVFNKEVFQSSPKLKTMRIDFNEKSLSKQSISSIYVPESVQEVLI
eukprot:gene13134-16028_t